MTPIRILVVDDRVVIRKLLSDTLSEDRSLQVVGVASDGRIALAKIAQLKPDLITLDVEMPVMNGLETLAALPKLYPKLPVIMFSTLAERGAAATLDALSLGASDYATKPGNTGNPAVALERIRTELIPKIKALCGVVTPLKLLPLPGCPPAARARTRSQPRIEIVAIGTSTGGPNALAEVLPLIPNDFPVPIVVVQVVADGCGRRMKQLGSRTPREYWNHLTVHPGRDGELRNLLNEITIGETSLFRSQPQLDALRKVILPEIVADQARQVSKRLRIWSAGCSTGEESYTLAMNMLEESDRLLKGWTVEIVATDLNDHSVETAKAG